MNEWMNELYNNTNNTIKKSIGMLHLNGRCGLCFEYPKSQTNDKWRIAATEYSHSAIVIPFFTLVVPEPRRNGLTYLKLCFPMWEKTHGCDKEWTFNNLTAQRDG